MHRIIIQLLLVVAILLGFHSTAVYAVTYTAANTIDLGPGVVNGIYGNQQGGNKDGVELWTGTSASFANFGGSGTADAIRGIGPGLQVGQLGNHAYVWGGYAAYSNDLNPTDLLGADAISFANATNNNEQVGAAAASSTSFNYHAILWHDGGTYNDVDLNPSALLGSNSQSFATGVNGVQQVGYGSGSNTSGASHALLWSGTPTSAVDLNPIALLGTGSQSTASAISGSQQVGSGSGNNTSGVSHAILWTGSAGSAVDLNPTALLGSGSQSFATGVNSVQQVGYGFGSYTSNKPHALLWTGSAGSAVDLQTLLPGPYVSSQATSIDPYGNIGGFATDNINSTHAIAWLAGDLFNVNGGSNGWQNDNNWSSGTPTTGSNVMVLNNGVGNQSVAYSSGAQSSVFNQLIIDGAGSMALEQTTGMLQSATEYVGYIGVGVHTQSDGTNIVGSLILAPKTGSQGTYSLSNNGVLSANLIQVNTGGTFSQNGGTLIANEFDLNGGTVTGTLKNQGLFKFINGQFNAKLVNQGTLDLGPIFTAQSGIENDANMTISSLQTVTANSSGFDNFGNLILAGGILNGSGAVINEASGTITAHGTIQKSVTNNGRFTLDGVLGITNSGTLTNNGILQGNGTLNGNFTNGSGGTVNVAANNSLSITNQWINPGLVNMQGNGSLLGGGQITNTGTIQGFGTIAAKINNNGVIRASGGELDMSASSNSNNTGSSIQVTAGSTIMFLQGLFNNSGTISLTGGTFDNNNHAMTSGTSSAMINGYGTIRTAGLSNSGKINVGEGNMDIFGSVTNLGTIGIQGGRSVYFYGNVSGNGSFTGPGTATFLAALSPGNSPASVSFGGNVDLTSASALNIELGGTTVGSQYDWLDVAGQLALGGALNVSLINSFKPTAGNSFDILNWSSLSGTFAGGVNLPALTGAVVWDTSALYTTGALSVIATYYKGDFNRDGHVNAADILSMESAIADLDSYQSAKALTPAQLLSIGDVNGDGAITSADMQNLLTNIKNGGGSADPVPEPLTFALLASGVALLAIRRRKRQCHG